MDTNEQQQDFLLNRIEALVIENARLNEELRKVKDVAFKVRLSDPIYDKPLSKLEVNYKMIKPCQTQ